MVFNKCDGSTDYMEKKRILTLTLHHTQKINPWWIIDIHVKSTKVNHLRESTEKDLCDIQVGKYFLYWSQKKP